MISIYAWDQTPQSIKQGVMKRACADMESLRETAIPWLEKIRTKGDEAVIEYIRKFDDSNFEGASLRVSEEEIALAYRSIDPGVLVMIREQIRISRAFHNEQASRLGSQWEIETVPGVVTGVKRVPIESVGLYVPAGKAPLPTVAQILAVAAKAAGVGRIAVCFPPTAPNLEIIVAAAEAGATEIYRVGGIAAIGALTYGTQTIKSVSKIVGPGNPYVQAAKLAVFGRVGIDMLSGPSEALIMADERSDPRFLAADILARCEHGGDSAGVVVTSSMEIAQETRAEVMRQAPLRTRQQFIQEALRRFSAIIVVKTEEEMIEFANEYGAEHLEIQTAEPARIFEKIRNAGSVFLGNFAPAAVGDYASGTNHCLPTGTAVKYASAIGVETFMRVVEYQRLTKAGLQRLAPIVQTISRVEGLDAHENSVNIRFS